MTKEPLSTLPLWDQFQKAAREQQHNPERLLTEYIRERLEIWADQQLDTEMQREAQQSGVREADAVTVVRQHHQEKQARLVAS